MKAITLKENLIDLLTRLATGEITLYKAQHQAIVLVDVCDRESKAAARVTVSKGARYVYRKEGGLIRATPGTITDYDFIEATEKLIGVLGGCGYELVETVKHTSNVGQIGLIIREAESK